MKVEDVNEDACIERENVTWTAAVGCTPVALAAGLRSRICGGWLGSSTTMFAAGVSGAAPMSARTFVVACWMRTSGSPLPSPVGARPHIQWFVPVWKMSEPLGSRCLVTLEMAEPGA